MRWPTFVIFAYLAVTLDTGLFTLLRVKIGGVAPAAPSFLLVLAVFIAVWAPPLTAAAAMLVLGALADLRIVDSEGAAAAILGPSALGFLLGGYLVLQLRAMFYRDSALALAVMTFAAGILIHLTTVTLLWMRAMPWPESWPLGGPLAGWRPADDLLRRFVELVYTTALAFPVGWLLLRYQWLWGFVPSKSGHGSRR